MPEGMGATEDAAARSVLAGQKQAFIPRSGTTLGHVAERLAILGTGKIGESLLAGLLSSGWSDVVVTSRRQARVDELRERYGVEATLSNAEAVAGADIVVLAVKPQDFPALLGEIAPSIST